MPSHKGAASLTSLPGLPRVSANLERPPGLQRSQEARPRKTHAPASDLWWVLDPLCEVPQSQSCPREGDEELGLGSPSGGRWPPARVASLVPKVLTGPGGRLSTWFTHLESKTVKPVTQEQWPPRGTLATSGDVRAGCCRRLEGGGRRCCSRSRGAQDGPPCWWCPWEAPPSERPGLCERSRHLSLLKSLFLLFRGVLFICLIGFTVSPPFAPSRSS